MRILFITFGVLGGLVGLASAYFLLAITMLAGGGNPSLARVFLYIVGALVIASVLGLVGGLLNPRKPSARRLSAASGAIWIGCALLIVLLAFIGETDPAKVLNAVKFAAIVCLPSAFPFANVALSIWQSRSAPQV